MSDLPQKKSVAFHTVKGIVLGTIFGLGVAAGINMASNGVGKKTIGISMLVGAAGDAILSYRQTVRHNELVDRLDALEGKVAGARAML